MSQISDRQAQEAIETLMDYFEDHKKAMKALGALNQLVEAKISGEDIFAKESTTHEASSSHQDVFPLPSELLSRTESEGLEKKSLFALFSDGGCRGNPGPGAYAYMIQNGFGEMLAEGCGVEHNTTNNQMELQGAIEALKYLKEYSSEEEGTNPHQVVYLFSDSKYVVDGANSWMPNWKKRGWTRSGNGQIQNLELWKDLDAQMESFKEVIFRWVKGHSGHPQNEFCDRLLNEALDDAGF